MTSLLVWNIQLSVNTTPKRKSLYNNLRESTVPGTLVREGSQNYFQSTVKLSIFPGVGIPASAQSRRCSRSRSTFNAEVHDGTRTRLQKFPGEILIFLKRTLDGHGFYLFTDNVMLLTSSSHEVVLSRVWSLRLWFLSQKREECLLWVWDEMLPQVEEWQEGEISVMSTIMWTKDKTVC